ncbi:hypothetical protein DXN04_31990 [Chitinophaga silvisoli]|uniref:Uncharacterized protein n=1 Tax=Chitinophaga silvisoli TaxID=2291814 RepID=A0A3E1NS46_9BACT|nr:hypothetical protein DXN04_31990 [Chitinophaga silvisoli]
MLRRLLKLFSIAWQLRRWLTINPFKYKKAFVIPLFVWLLKFNVKLKRNCNNLVSMSRKLSNFDSYLSFLNSKPVQFLLIGRSFWVDAKLGKSLFPAKFRLCYIKNFKFDQTELIL